MSDGLYGLLGINGAGKTTLINILMGITRCDGGEIYVDGTNVRKLGVDYLKQLGYLPQYPQFYKDFTVEEFLEYMSAIKGISKKKEPLRIDELLQEVNLSESRKQKIGTLSGGMRQRLGIAQAIINDPKILILDEPTAGLDPQERIRFRNLISKLSKNRITILATHIVSDVEYIANHVILMGEGTILAEGTVRELEQTLENQVWEVCREESAGIDDLDVHIISNMRRDKDRILYHVIGSQPADGVSADVTLEDVFLYWCRRQQI